MKYVVVLYDGMADYPVPALGGKTPMMVAKKPNFDRMAQKGEVGLVRTVAEGLTLAATLQTFPLWATTLSSITQAALPLRR